VKKNPGPFDETGQDSMILKAATESNSRLIRPVAADKQQERLTAMFESP